MRGMFAATANFNGNISTWNVEKVTDMSYMFNHSVFNRPLTGWKPKALEHTDYMFANNHYTPMDN